MENQVIIFYLALVVFLGCLGKIYVRVKGLGARVEKDRKGNKIPYQPKLAGPIVVAIASLIAVLLTAH